MAIAHDYLNQRGGAERVVLELARQWPQAAIYTTLYRPGSTFSEFATHQVRTSWVDRLPVDRRFRALLVAYPSAVRSLGVLPAEIVISSSSGWAHAVRTRPDAVHVCYCHTPARWLWDPAAYNQTALSRAALLPVRTALRAWDRRVAARPTAFVANSQRTRGAIGRIYGRDAAVIHPPVSLERFHPRRRGDRLLVVSRLLSYKRVDLAIDAARHAGLGLDVVGDGPMLDDLRARASDGVRFHGRVDDHTLTEMLEGCRALVLPGVEDFGIAPVEANAAGKPVVAFGAGGVLESQIEGRTAAYFNEPTAEALAAAVRRCDELSTPPEALRANAARFAPERFRALMAAEVDRVAAQSASVAR